MGYDCPELDNKNSVMKPREKDSTTVKCLCQRQESVKRRDKASKTQGICIVCKSNNDVCLCNFHTKNSLNQSIGSKNGVCKYHRNKSANGDKSEGRKRGCTCNKHDRDQEKGCTPCTRKKSKNNNKHGKDCGKLAKACDHSKKDEKPCEKKPPCDDKKEPKKISFQGLKDQELEENFDKSDTCPCDKCKAKRSSCKHDVVKKCDQKQTCAICDLLVGKSEKSCVKEKPSPCRQREPQDSCGKNEKRSNSSCGKRNRSPSPSKKPHQHQSQRDKGKQQCSICDPIFTKLEKGRGRSPSPKRGKSPSPKCSRSPSPKRGRSPSPKSSRSPSPKHSRSPSPKRGRSPSPFESEKCSLCAVLFTKPENPCDKCDRSKSPCGKRDRLPSSGPKREKSCNKRENSYRDTQKSGKAKKKKYDKNSNFEQEKRNKEKCAKEVEETLVFLEKELVKYPCTSKFLKDLAEEFKRDGCIFSETECDKCNEVASKNRNQSGASGNRSEVTSQCSWSSGENYAQGSHENNFGCSSSTSEPCCCKEPKKSFFDCLMETLRMFRGDNYQ